MWGKGFHGQLGQMVKMYGSYETTPVRVSLNGHAVHAVAMGSRHCVVLVAWGSLSPPMGSLPLMRVSAENKNYPWAPWARKAHWHWSHWRTKR